MYLSKIICKKVPMKLLCTRNAATVSAAATNALQKEQPSGEAMIARPRLVDLDKRWGIMSQEEKDGLITDLYARQKQPWTTLSIEEKKAAYWIAFGEHGPRAFSHISQKTVFWGTVAGLTIGVVLFGLIRTQAAPSPRTMTREWQEKSNEYMKENKINPISGEASEGFKGRGQISGGIFSPSEKDKK
ncbi:cytochrome c oxidase subunit V [Schizosaccharomyces pombe]|uniref:Cytochrome c oxidase polypeptide 5, mitochondrial n=2 Tax=Schizosaccharomyces pombe TaxID=4896 RepID=COX5_SCHPO|nr:putative cytochrome c oxidase subunit V [Schizosaccharomyces pombe]O74988.2 RecName: Full=Cytochrome c oxidase polypeptide 5, mitochondrial; AltName: Full=Cytochrome c oxidase polypeptide V; Flags: Precursor [Schizosaccharomyces pombe 972h-]CAA19341.2 cytochrome c oxidase subunit V (predicted) [Schizosaccharomyces pombe]|eukprot:NP_588158.2 putative cytochrome c oxidase subunit V [Schizosaccharomyces pombe]